MENKKILLVQYTPRYERSKTKELLDYTKSLLEKKGKVEVLDLNKDIPEFFNSENLTAYYMRNYMKEKLSDKDAKLLSKFDRFTKQFVDANIVVVAYPMYNFSMPASVKAYFDMILLKGQTWDMNEKGYVQLCNGKELLLITTSGGVYNEEFKTISMDHSESYMKSLSGFIGTNFNCVFVQGINMMPAKEKDLMTDGKKKIEKIVSKYK